MGFKLNFTALILLSFNSCQGPSDQNYPARVTADKLLSIQIDMSKEQVRDILGDPITEERNLFQYTEKRLFDYPMIWIHFDSSKVREVYVKSYSILDERGIYGLSWDQKTGSIHQWGRAALRKTIRSF